MEKKELKNKTDIRSHEAEEPDSVPLLSPLTFDLESWGSLADSGMNMGFGLELGWPSQEGFGEDVDHDDADNDVVDDDHVMGSSPSTVLSQGPPSPLFPTLPCIIPGQGQPYRQALSEHPDDQGHPLLGNHDCIPPTGLICSLLPLLL